MTTSAFERGFLGGTLSGLAGLAQGGLSGLAGLANPLAQAQMNSQQQQYSQAVSQWQEIAQRQVARAQTEILRREHPEMFEYRDYGRELVIKDEFKKAIRDDTFYFSYYRQLRAEVEAWLPKFAA